MISLLLFDKVLSFHTRILTNQKPELVMVRTFRWNYGTKIQTGKTHKKIYLNIGNSACRWFIVKKAKFFSSYVK